MQSSTTVFLGLILLQGCAFNPQPYNGYSGYTIEQQTATTATITYIDKASHNDKAILNATQRACADVLHTKPSQISMQVQDQSQFSKLIYFEAAIRSINTPQGSSLIGVGEGIPIPMQYNNAKVAKTIDFLQITALCNHMPTNVP